MLCSTASNQHAGVVYRRHTALMQLSVLITLCSTVPAHTLRISAEAQDCLQAPLTILSDQSNVWYIFPAALTHTVLIANMLQSVKWTTALAITWPEAITHRSLQRIWTKFKLVKRKMEVKSDFRVGLRLFSNSRLGICLIQVLQWVVILNLAVIFGIIFS